MDTESIISSWCPRNDPARRVYHIYVFSPPELPLIYPLVKAAIRRCACESSHAKGQTAFRWPQSTPPWSMGRRRGAGGFLFVILCASLYSVFILLVSVSVLFDQFDPRVSLTLFFPHEAASSGGVDRTRAPPVLGNREVRQLERAPDRVNRTHVGGYNEFARHA